MLSSVLLFCCLRLPLCLVIRHGPEVLGLLAEVEVRSQMLIHSKITQNPEHRTASGLHRLHPGLAGEDCMLCAQLLHHSECIEDPHRDRVLLLNLLPRELSSVEISGVRPFLRILLICIVIELADLIPGINDRDTALREQPGMQHQDAGNRLLLLRLVLLIECRLQPTEGRSRPAESRVSELRIVVVQLTPAVAAIPASGQVIVQVLLMRDLINPKLLEPVIVQPPADVIMASEIVLLAIVVTL